MADGTWANKTSHLRSYITFAVYFGVPDFPMTLKVLLRFIAFLSRGPHAYRSATNLLGSLKWFAAFIDPPAVQLFESAFVTASLKGLKAKLSRPPSQKLPITMDHMVKFYYILDFSDIKQLAAWCAMLLSFFGCLRLSNLVPGSRAKFNTSKHLSVSDIVFEKRLFLSTISIQRLIRTQVKLHGFQSKQWQTKDLT